MIVGRVEVRFRWWARPYLYAAYGAALSALPFVDASRVQAFIYRQAEFICERGTVVRVVPS